MILADVMQEVKLVNGTFTPSEARDIVSGIIDKQINFYKLQHLSKWVGNNNTSPDSIDKKIAALQKERAEFMKMINQAKREGLRLTLNSGMEVVLEK